MVNKYLGNIQIPKRERREEAFKKPYLRGGGKEREERRGKEASVTSKKSSTHK